MTTKVKAPNSRVINLEGSMNSNIFFQLDGEESFIKVFINQFEGTKEFVLVDDRKSYPDNIVIKYEI